MDERPEVLTGLHVYEEDGQHQVETGSAKTHSVDRRVANKHLTVTSTVGLVTHHVKERHLDTTHTHTHTHFNACSGSFQVQGASALTHVLPDELRDGAGQHEAGHGTAHDVEQGVHHPRAGGRFDRWAEGTAERTGSWSTAAAYLRRGRARVVATHPGETADTRTKPPPSTRAGGQMEPAGS